MDKLKDIQKWDSKKSHQDLTSGYSIVGTYIRGVTYSEIKNPDILSRINLREPQKRNSYFINVRDAKKGRFIEDVLPDDVLSSKKYTVFNCDEKEASYWDRSFVPSYIPVIKHIKKLNVFCLAIYCTDLRRYGIEPNGLKSTMLRECFRLYVDEEKNCYMRTLGNIIAHNTYHTEDTVVRANGTADLKTLGAIIREMAKQKISKTVDGKRIGDALSVFREMFGEVLSIGSFKYYRADSLRNVYEFVKKKEPRPIRGKRASIIEELDKEHVFVEKKYCSTISNGYVSFIERINQEWVAFRMMSNDENLLNMHEYARIYISRDVVIPCRISNFNKKISLDIKIPEREWTSCLASFNKEDVDGTILENVSDIILGLGDKQRTFFVLSYLGNRWIEKIASSELGFLIPYIISYEQQDLSMPTSAFSKFFSGLNSNSKTLSKMIGFNKHQQTKIAEHAMKNLSEQNYLSYTAFLRYVKSSLKPIEKPRCKTRTLSGDLSVSHVDNKTFDSVFDTISEVCISSGKFDDTRMFYLSDILSSILTKQGRNCMVAMAPKIVAASKVGAGVTIKSGTPGLTVVHVLDSITMIREHLILCRTLGIKPNINFILKIIDNPLIGDIHDALVFDERTVMGRTNKQVLLKKHFTLGADGVYSKEPIYYEDNDVIIYSPTSYMEIMNAERCLHNGIIKSLDGVLEGDTRVVLVKKKKSGTVCYTAEISEQNILKRFSGYGGICGSQALKCNLTIAHSLTSWMSKFDITWE